MTLTARGKSNLTLADFTTSEVAQFLGALRSLCFPTQLESIHIPILGALAQVRPELHLELSDFNLSPAPGRVALFLNPVTF